MVVLIHVRVQQRGDGHGDTDSRVAWWRIMVQAKGEEEVEKGYN